MTISEGLFSAEIRLGTVVEALPFPEAKKPAIKMEIDFGPEIGRKWSSAQITTHYSPDSVVGRQVVAVLNLGTRRIAGFASEVLVLGVMETPTSVILLSRWSERTRAGVGACAEPKKEKACEP